MKARNDLTGQRFGKLIVTGFSHRNKDGKSCYICVCDCGGAKVICGGSLVSGLTRSCGCLRIGGPGSLPKHGMSFTPEYKAWCNMKNRCLNPKLPIYKYYGGRGIKVCDRWMNSFENFLADMGKKPSLELTIDRVDNNGNYEPGNCRWATMKEQSFNKRTTKLRKAS
jgi:hypothetical protein